jgi:hypothetical protein
MEEDSRQNTHLRWIMGQQQYATLQRTAASSLEQEAEDNS